MSKENTEEQSEWRLNKIEIKFEQGWSHKEKKEEQVDRYVGKISFTNKDNESFNLNIPQGMTRRYLDLMSEDIVKTAQQLGDKIAQSIKKQKDTNEKQA